MILEDSGLSTFDCYALASVCMYVVSSVASDLVFRWSTEFNGLVCFEDSVVL
jgi:hypothetical protein